MEKNLAHTFADNVHGYAFIRKTSWDNETKKLREAEEKFQLHKDSQTLTEWDAAISHAEQYVNFKEQENPLHRHTRERRQYLDRERGKHTLGQLEVYVLAVDCNKVVYAQDNTKENLSAWEHSLYVAQQFVSNNNLIYPALDQLKMQYDQAEKKYQSQHSWFKSCVSFWGCKNGDDSVNECELQAELAGPEYHQMI